MGRVEKDEGKRTALFIQPRGVFGILSDEHFSTHFARQPVAFHQTHL
jgi:hypothetical protein